MPLVSRSVPNLIGGVSQQPQALRLSNQGEEQINADSSILSGLKRRPSAKHLWKHPQSSELNVDKLFTHAINRDNEEKYHLAIDKTGAISVVNLLTGSACSVSKPDDMTYFDSTNPEADYTAITVADHTFLVNKKKLVAMSNETTPARANSALIVWQSCYSESFYDVSINGEAIQQIKTGGDPDSTRLTVWLDQMYYRLVAKFGTTDWVFVKDSHCIFVKRVDGADFTIHVKDTRANTTIYVLKDSIEEYSKLPKRAPNGLIVKVRNTNATEWDDYYIQFEAKNSSTAVGAFDEGLWREIPEPGIKYRLNEKTLPYKLVRTGPDAFTLSPIEWGERIAGSEDTAPEPTFVGRAIQDVFFYRNRLCFLSDENCICSRAGEYYDFFVSTVTAMIDSDPVDIPSTSNQVSLLKHGVPFAETVVLFSPYAQFYLSGGETLFSQSTATIKPLSNFPYYDAVRPVASGNNLYFPFLRGDHIGISEFFVDEENGNADTVDITAHVSRYVPSGVKKLVNSPNEGALVCLCSDTPDTLYVYRYYWAGNEKVQSAWFKWTYTDAHILDIFFIDSELFMVVKYTDGIYFLSSRVDSAYKDDGCPFEFSMDRKVTDLECSVSYNFNTNRTTWTLPYPLTANQEPVVAIRYGERATNPGFEITAVKDLPNTVVAVGNYSTVPVFVGVRHSMYYKFSPQYMKESKNSGGEVTITDGRLQMRRWLLVYGESGHFEVHVTPLNREKHVYTFANGVIGSYPTGTFELQSGSFAFPVLSKNDSVTVELVSDSHLPCSFTSLEWEGEFFIRSKRVS
jgi:hypothetical protein